MPLSQVGGGYQVGDGNINEMQMTVQGDPATPTATATLTAAQILAGLIVANPSTTAASYTLPTVASLEAPGNLVNAKISSAFEITLVNTGTASGAVTLLVGTGWTIVGNAVVAVTSSSKWLARKTGDGAWTLYRSA